jgi:hypothetical protein
VRRLSLSQRGVKAASKADAAPAAKGPAAKQLATPSRTAQAAGERAEVLLAPEGPLQHAVNERLERMGVDLATVVPLADAYHVSFPPSAWGRGDSKVLQRTADAVATFIADAHVANRGQHSDAFRTVEVLPFAETRDTMRIEAAEKKLVLGLKSTPWALLTQIRPQLPKHQAAVATKLKQQWSQGQQFDSKALRRVWPLLNPTGELRLTLGQSVRGPATELDQALLMVRNSSDSLSTRRNATLRLVTGAVNGQVTSDVSRELIVDEARTVIAGLDDEGLKTFIDRYRSRLADPGLHASATTAIQNAVLTRDLDAKIRIDGGLVAVGNLHDINVDASFAANGFSRLSRYVTEVSAHRKIDAEVKSKGVAVFTIDLIDVNATFDVMRRTATDQKVVPTAALDETLDAFR